MMDRPTVPGGFLCESDRMPGQVFVLTEPWKEEFKTQLQRDRVVGIRLSRSAGWKGESLGFLADLPSLKSVEVYDWDVKDLSPLYEQPQLEHIGLECQFKRVDFSRFEQLKIFGVTWRPGTETVFDCAGLTYLNVDKYPYEDLSPLKKLQRLERLVLFSRKLTRLGGLADLPALRQLDCAYCSSLSDVNAIQDATNLVFAGFSSCKKIRDLTPFGQLLRLEGLALDDCDKVASVKPLKTCNALKRLSLVGVSVEDGALEMLLKMKSLRNVRLAKKRHHSHTAAQINAALADC